MIRKLFKLSCILVFVIGLLYVVAYFWLHQNAGDFISKEDKEKVVMAFEKSQELSSTFYNALEEYYPDLYTERTLNNTLKRHVGFEVARCQCNEIYWVPLLGVSNLWNRNHILTKLFVEQNFTQKDCLTFYMNYSDFGSLTDGVFQISRDYFGKELKDLTSEEVVKLYEML